MPKINDGDIGIWDWREIIYSILVVGQLKHGCNPEVETNMFILASVAKEIIPNNFS